MTPPLRILNVAPEWPWPGRTGSEIVAGHHLRSLARRHFVTLLGLSRHPDPNPPTGPSVTAEFRAFEKRTSALNRSLRIIAGEPPQLGAFASPYLAQAVADALPRHDVAVFQMTQTAQFLPRGATTPAVWALEESTGYQEPLLAANPGPGCEDNHLGANPTIAALRAKDDVAIRSSTPLKPAMRTIAGMEKASSRKLVRASSRMAIEPRSTR